MQGLVYLGSLLQVSCMCKRLCRYTRAQVICEYCICTDPAHGQNRCAYECNSSLLEYRRIKMIRNIELDSNRHLTLALLFVEIASFRLTHFKIVHIRLTSPRTIQAYEPRRHRQRELHRWGDSFPGTI